ncbi:hypothetical protein [Frisingicoccus sp.]|uniref:hypothetical protein n=1 Tax=Frisingicoccus sp. TaxID=1918627 RepID=UPI002E783D50|nr:hypothetical protein [Frisingicoccus sp.]MEE0751778.1 hypothetical protein [Frisingicoccus sp.]
MSVKKTGPVVLLLLLAACVFGPGLLLKMQEKSVVNQIHTEPVPENSMEYGGHSDLSTTDKIEQILKARSGTDRMVYENFFPLKDINGEIKKKIKSELKKIMELGILETMDLDGMDPEQYTCISYVNRQNMQETFSVWTGIVTMDDRELYLVMDSETGMIYEFSMMTPAMEGHDEAFDDDGAAPEGILLEFQKYLGLTWEEFCAYYNLSFAPESISLNW